MTHVTLRPRTQNDPHFNQAAADVIYKSMSAMDPDTALVYGRLIVAGGVHHDLVAHHAAVSKAVAADAFLRASRMRDHYSREAISKARDGVDNSAEIRYLTEIHKAFDFTTQQLSQWASKQPRDASGRFTAEHTNVTSDESKPPQDQKTAAKDKIPTHGKLEGHDLAAFQQAYHQVQDLLAPYSNTDLKPMLHLRVHGRGGDDREETLGVLPNGKPENFASAVAPGDRIRSASVSVNPDATAQGAAFDTLAAFGAPRAGARLANAYEGALNPRRLSEFNSAINEPIDAEEPHSASRRAFNRLEQGSKLLQDSLGEAAPPKAQFALAVANHVGQFGPEAQKVIGPAADRAAYRYRGTERELDPRLGAAMKRLREDDDITNARQFRRAASDGVQRRNGWDPGPVLEYFHNQLPDPDLNELQRKSGVIPPSEGIIISADGRVTTQSSGYADDWYLPFNLKNLASLKGGEYIRTRSFGGPTTEDIYTGLLSGAKSVSVVSHNGVYTIDFDRNLRGGRRFNDKATRMVGRYGHLLDSLRSGEVMRGSITPSRLDELRSQAQDVTGETSGPDFGAELSRLKDDERRDPKMSEAERSEAAMDWLSRVAQGVGTADGRTMDAEQLLTTVKDRAARQHFNADKQRASENGREFIGRLPDYQRFQEREMRGIDGEADATKLAEYVAAQLGKTDSLENYMNAARAEARDRASRLQLNGKGYRDALKALQEQFPYYIANVEYHPWRNAAGAGDRTHEAQRDTGYVPPRHNRPEQALAGYYNPDVYGRSNRKVKASTTRYQNRRVHRNGPVPADREDQAAQSTATVGNERRAGQTGERGRPGAEPSEETRQELRNAADHQMLDELLDENTFAPGAKLGGVDFSNANIRSEVQDSRFPNKAVKEFYSTPRQELESKLDDPETADQVRRLMRDIEGLTHGPEKVFAGPKQETVKAFRNEGKIEKPKEMPESTSAMLREIDRDHDFPGVAYDPARMATPDQVRSAFDKNEGVQKLVAGNGLPDLDSPDFEDAVSRIKSDISNRETKRLRRSSLGGTTNDAQGRADKKAARSLAQAAQLHRRYQEAKENQPAVTPTPVGADQPDYVEQNSVVFPNVTAADLGNLSDDELKRFLANTQIANTPESQTPGPGTA